MKRYFYRDLIIALWLAKNHDVLFYHPTYTGTVPFTLINGKFKDAAGRKFPGKKIFVHPDSVAFFTGMDKYKVTAMKLLDIWPQEEIEDVI